jgi:membrane fusion protein (multidrug efflux system)
VLSGLLTFLYSCQQKEARQMPPPEIEIVNVIVQDVPIMREFVGQAYGQVDIPIRARVDGFLEEKDFDEGARVKKGQLLYKIDPQPFLAEEAAQVQRVAEAQTYLVNATNELNRYEPLVKINAVSQSDYDAALASKEAAEASLKAAEANLRLAQINLSYTVIRSPIDGLIGKTEADVGEYVGKEPNPVILNTVSKIREVRIRFFLPETDYIALARQVDMRETQKRPEERKTQTNVELMLADGTLYEERGYIDYVDRNVDASTGSMLVQARFPNPNDILRPGMYTKVRITLATAESAMLVPQRCVIELQGQYSVYIVDESNTVSARQLEATQRIGDLWLIEEGLKPDDKVVLTGLQKVAAGVTANPTLVEFESKANQ